MLENVTVRPNVFIEDATELSQEIVYANANKILQMKYSADGVEKELNKMIWKAFLLKTSFMFKKKLTLQEQKECILKLVLFYKSMYPTCFTSVGYYDKKVALERETTSL